MDTKWCGAGQHEVATTNFWKRRGKLQPNCIDCQKAINKKRYEDNRTKHIRHVRQNIKQREQTFFEWKETLQCVRCDENYRQCLEFHHINPEEKDFAISGALSRTGWNNMIEEISKCVVLCGNCHTKVHGGALSVTEDDLCDVSLLLEMTGV